MSDINWEDLVNEDDDPFGIKNSAPKTATQTANTRLVNSFEEINKFIDDNGRLPNENGDVIEKKLFLRLKGLKENDVKSQKLKEFDRHNLLNVEILEKKIETLEDIYEDDYFNETLKNDDDIFSLKHVKSTPQRQKTDFVARRKQCKDFPKYEDLFKACQLALKTNEKKLIKFDENQIAEGEFFIVHGIMVYVDKLYDIKRVQRGYENKFDGRTRLIFENGTESNMRYRSLCKRLYENGFHVSHSSQECEDRLYGITDKDKPTGNIYVLKSLSRDENVKNIRNLYKIGYCETSVAERIKNAQNEPTYLMAPVKIVAEYKTFNMNTEKFELLLHRFLGNCCVSIEIYDNNGSKHTPREWFQVPYEVINEAIHLIISGEIMNYKYDRNIQEIVHL